MDTMGGDLSESATGRGTAVEFVYRPTAADFEEALRARARRTWAGRSQVLMGLLAVPATACVLALFFDTAPAVWGVTVVLSLIFASVGVVMALRAEARRMFSVVEPFGRCRMVADEGGAVSTGERMSFTCEWSVYRGYLETSRLFVLFGGERSAGVAVLPKRGAEGPEDVERLRAILDRNLKRL
ncbi:hypothetical protein CIB93_11225 [Streptomyces sp. WZ.A104]|uniref:YcxB family protein n=1 Tax=Streptomyces sp. WZ.A104 TaxID=2023771 RepID=UPI000BBB9EA8|nr:YcxB family protein [Streptomyces sp. WZ.A104]PCG86063.1 hypothetical protein CIB93_11225 [Streptomyces sp. WZ.A104]